MKITIVGLVRIFNTILCFPFRDALKRNYNLSNYWVEINIEDLSSFDEVLAEKLYKKPTEHLPILEEAAKEVHLEHYLSNSAKECSCSYGIIIKLLYMFSASR